MSLARRTPLKARTPLQRKTKLKAKGWMKRKGRRPDPLGRRLATKPCANCGIVGFSQGAHMSLSRNEKGTGMTVADVQRVPLCCSRPGILGCHAEFDQRTGQFKGWSDERRWKKARAWLGAVA